MRRVVLVLVLLRPGGSSRRLTPTSASRPASAVTARRRVSTSSGCATRASATTTETVWRSGSSIGWLGPLSIMRCDRLVVLGGTWRVARWCSALISALVLAWPATHGQELRRPLRLPAVSGFVTLIGRFPSALGVFRRRGLADGPCPLGVARRGSDALSLTEHREDRPHAADLAGSAMRAYEVARPLADQLGMILVPGVEITRPVPGRPSPWPVGSAHFNALGHPGRWAARCRRSSPTRSGSRNARVLSSRGTIPRSWAGGLSGFRTWTRCTGRDSSKASRSSTETSTRPRRSDGCSRSSSRSWPPATRTCRCPRTSDSARRPATILFAVTRDAAGVRDALEVRRTLAWLDDDMWEEEQWHARPGTGPCAPRPFRRVLARSSWRPSRTSRRFRSI